MRFATYGRKSVYSDKSDSVDNQERMCREYADFRFKGHVESFEAYSDEGLSGANTDRPGLKRLLSDVEDGHIDALIVYQLDRLSRDVKDFANIYCKLEEKGVMFISLKESIDTNTPIGKAMMFITATFAQMERETIAARVTDNLTGLAKKGFWLGGKPPYGYVTKRIEVNGKKHVTLAIDPESSEYVKWLYNTFLDNKYSVQQMETALRRQGIRTVNGAFFSGSQLHRTLSMPYYAQATQEIYDYFSDLGCQMDSSPRESWDGTHGVMLYGRTGSNKSTVQPHSNWIVCVGMHAPFISAETWLSAQELLHKNIFDKTLKYNVPLLKGVLRCAKCGCKMQIGRKKVKDRVDSRYRCLKRIHEGKEGCDTRSIKCEKLDNQVLDIFRKIELDPETVKEYAGISQPQDHSDAIKKKEAEASRLRTRINHLTDALAMAEKSSAAQYIIAQIESENLNLDAIKRDIELTKAKLRQEQKETVSLEKKVSEIIHMMQGLDNFTDVERNEIIREVVQECTWNGETLFLRL